MYGNFVSVFQTKKKFYVYFLNPWAWAKYINFWKKEKLPAWKEQQIPSSYSIVAPLNNKRKC